jgi:hypothetical protein
MGWYGTLLLARPGTGNLPAYPGVRQAFGSWFATPPRIPPLDNRLGLHDLGDGWQRVAVTPAYRERLRLAEGVQELAVATAAPVLAGWVSESVCAHLEAATPAGRALSMHLPNTDDDCGYQHPGGRPGPVEPPRAIEALEAWAEQAGRTLARETTAALVHGVWDESPYMEDKMLALFGALGYPAGRQILPVVDPQDPAVGGYDITIAMADRHASELVHAAQRGYLLGPEHDLTPKERDYLRFSDLVWSSVYGGGLSRDELIAEYKHLTSRWPE